MDYLKCVFWISSDRPDRILFFKWQKKIDFGDLVWIGILLQLGFGFR